MFATLPAYLDYPPYIPVLSTHLPACFDLPYLPTYLNTLTDHTHVLTNLYHFPTIPTYITYLMGLPACLACHACLACMPTLSTCLTYLLYLLIYLPTCLAFLIYLAFLTFLPTYLSCLF